MDDLVVWLFIVLGLLMFMLVGLIVCEFLIGREINGKYYYRKWYREMCRWLKF